LSERRSLERFLKAHADAWLRRAGHSPVMVDAAKREAGAWLHARRAALRSRGRLYGGWGVVWTNAGHGTVELVPVEVPAPARDEVTVAIHVSAVSPGTERAYYLRLPHAQPRIPFRPGYSAAGVVVATGPDAGGLRPGDRVAVIGAPHASVATVSSAYAHAVPESVDMAAAATVMLGVIAAQGVERAQIPQGVRVCIVGAGIVGLVAQRLASAAGAGRITVVATSRRREVAARAGGADFLVAGDDAVADLAAPVVIEATGDPAAIATAIAAAGAGGRVVLLGSPRGATTAFPLQAVLDKRLEVVGAHVNAPHPRSSAELARDYLGLLATGHVRVDDLVARRVDPREAELLYRELATGRGITGALFEWTLLDEHERVRPSALLQLPDLSGRGADSTRRLAAPTRGRRRVAGLLPHESDPFAGARGRLRFGLIGCGDIALHNAGAIAAAPNTELTATYDLDPALSREVAAPHGAAVARSAEELLERDDVDAVFLAVPHHLHAPLARQAAGAGKHVVVEKPPAEGLTSAVEMVTATEEAGVVLTVCLPHRYTPAVVSARRLVDHGAVGDITCVGAELLMDRSPAYRLGGFSGRAISDWRASRAKAGGGVLIMNLSHYLDLLLHVSGLAVDVVSAFASGPTDGVEDTIALSLRLENGAPGSVLGTTQARGSVFTELRICGSAGQIALEHEPRFYMLRSVDGLRTTRWQTFGRLPAVDIRAAFVSRLATAIANGEEPDVPARDALRLQATIEAAYRSVESGRPVRPDELLEAAPA
jgi:2-desacetyl-2-hydroxyethyl bacteriochlorophyllide A dehydrogenase